MSTTLMPVPPTEPDPIARLATGAVGGPVGRFAAGVGGRRWMYATAGAASLLSCVMIALGVLQKSWCARFGWSAPGSYWKACYSDLPALATRTGLASGNPYDRADPLTDPLGMGVTAHLLSAFVPAGGLERQTGFFIAWAILAAVLTVVTVVAVTFTLRTRPSAALHVALSPLLVTVALVSTDLVGIALVALGIWAWSRERSVAAGILLGLALTTKMPALIVLVAMLLICVRAGVWRRWAATAGVAILTLVAALALAGVVYGGGVFTPYRTWLAASAHLHSTWYLATLAGHPVSVGVLTLVAVLGWCLALAAGGLMALGAPVRPRLAEVALVMTVIVLLTGKMLPVQASLWLVPLVALAGVPWRDHLIWAAAEIVSFVAVWLYLGGLDHAEAALPVGWYCAAVVLRLLGLAWLALGTALRAARRTPWVQEIDDAAGPASGMPDALVVKYAR